MKMATKNLIIKTLEIRIRDYEKSIEHCESSGTFSDHIKKLLLKVDQLKSAIAELIQLTEGSK